MQMALDVSVTNHWITGLLVLIGIFGVLGVLGFVAFRWSEGLWGSILLSCNIFFASIITINYYEALSKMLSKSAPFGLFYWDGVVFVVMILILLAVLNLITNRISRVIVAFPGAVESSAKPLLLLLIAFVQMLPLIYFFCQIGAMSPKPLAGTVQIESRGKTTDPEMVLVNLASVASKGSLSAMSGPTQFDPNHDFMLREYNKRCALFMSLWSNNTSLYKGETGFLGD